MAVNKTKATDVNIDDYIAAIEDESRRQDCEALIDLIGKITRTKPQMWGESIVGFGSYHYKYASRREGDMCATGFSSRKGDISIYLLADGPKQTELLNKPGKHKMGKSCLYVRRLADIDTRVLQQLIAGSLPRSNADTDDRPPSLLSRSQRPCARHSTKEKFSSRTNTDDISENCNDADLPDAAGRLRFATRADIRQFGSRHGDAH
jgi:hypothetical protein